MKIGDVKVEFTTYEGDRMSSTMLNAVVEVVWEEALQQAFRSTAIRNVAVYSLDEGEPEWVRCIPLHSFTFSGEPRF